MKLVAEILGVILVVVGLIGYSTLIPTPAAPRGQWLPRSFAASGVAAVCVLAAVILWHAGGGTDRDRLWSLLRSVGPYMAGGGLGLAAGTYLKVRLWSLRDAAIDRWLSKHK